MVLSSGGAAAAAARGSCGVTTTTLRSGCVAVRAPLVAAIAVRSATPNGTTVAFRANPSHH